MWHTKKAILESNCIQQLSLVCSLIVKQLNGFLPERQVSSFSYYDSQEVQSILHLERSRIVNKASCYAITYSTQYTVIHIQKMYALCQKGKFHKTRRDSNSHIYLPMTEMASRDAYVWMNQHRCHSTWNTMNLLMELYWTCAASHLSRELK